MAIKKRYTEKQIEFIKHRKDKGDSWQDVTSKFNKKYKKSISEESCRKLLSYNKDKASDDINDRILIVPDLHAPYSHKDAFAFIKAIKEKYNPTRVVFMGDEVDNHALSYHDTDPDLFSAGEELQRSIKYLSKFYELFPVVDVLDSNHGSMHYRKSKTHGLPRKYIREYNDILEAPEGWVWHIDLMLKLPDGNRCYFNHGLSANIANVVKLRGVCIVQGHYHSVSTITYASNPDNLIWGLQVGCLIDKKSMAFAYDRTNLKRPILGAAMIIDGQPKLIPMVVGKGGRWNKKVF